MKIIYIIFIFLFQNVFTSKKSGTCPSPTFHGICGILCKDDSNCDDDLKCCRTGCGGKACTLPTNTKSGICPIPSYTKEECKVIKFVTCNDDYNCNEHEKCCYNGCGKACTTPNNNTDKIGICQEPYLNKYKCKNIKLPTCKKDKYCPGTLKCCNNGCSKTCLAPKDKKPGGCPMPGINNKERCKVIKYIPCENDSTCTDDLKCCYNGCGLACVEPLMSKPGVCSNKINNMQCLRKVCTNDWECPGNNKCCNNGCICSNPVFNRKKFF